MGRHGPCHPWRRGRHARRPLRQQHRVSAYRLETARVVPRRVLCRVPRSAELRGPKTRISMYRLFLVSATTGFRNSGQNRRAARLPGQGTAPSASHGWMWRWTHPSTLRCRRTCLLPHDWSREVRTEIALPKAPPRHQGMMGPVPQVVTEGLARLAPAALRPRHPSAQGRRSTQTSCVPTASSGPYPRRALARTGARSCCHRRPTHRQIRGARSQEMAAGPREQRA